MNKHENSTKRSTNIIVCMDSKSPFWIAQFTAPNGRRVRRSTKVPVSGGTFEGSKISKSQAKSRAMLIALDLARLAEEEAASETNMTVRELFDTMLHGKLGRVCQDTYNNAKSDYGVKRKVCGNRISDLRVSHRCTPRARVVGSC